MSVAAPLFAAVHIAAAAAVCVVVPWAQLSWRELCAAWAVGVAWRVWVVGAVLHRVFAHHSVVPRNGLCSLLLGVVACTAMEGAPLSWAARHRAHHAEPHRNHAPASASVSVQAPVQKTKAKASANGDAKRDVNTDSAGVGAGTSGIGDGPDSLPTAPAVPATWKPHTLLQTPRLGCVECRVSVREYVRFWQTQAPAAATAVPLHTDPLAIRGLMALERVHLLPAVAFACAFAHVLFARGLPLCGLPGGHGLGVGLGVWYVSQVVVWHMTAFVCDHSLAQLWGGTRAFLPATAAPCNGVDNWLVALLTGGEGFLDAHHSHTRSSRFGWQSAWYEFDAHYLSLRVLSALGVVTAPDVPDAPAAQHAVSQSSSQSQARAPRLPQFVHNCVYRGTVHHTRLAPVYNRFSYPIYFVCTELSALTDHMFDRFWLWSSSRWRAPWAVALGSFRAGDYHSAAAIKALVARDCHPLTTPPVARVFLLTHWRYWGFSFNPVSYYFCYAARTHTRTGERVDPAVAARDADCDPDQPLGALVAMVSEVSNTPWGQKCWYVHSTCNPLNPLNGAGGDARGPAPLPRSIPSPDAVVRRDLDSALYFDRVVKKMHVSPFMEMDYHYQLHFSQPRAHWHVQWVMEKQPKPTTPPGAAAATAVTATASAFDFDAAARPLSAAERKPGGRPAAALEAIHFKASMTLARDGVSQYALCRVLVAYPFMTARVVCGIYWQALKLYANKRITFFAHPDPNQSLF